jgi:hypothetical protein
MPTGDPLERIDLHMERGNALMERSNELMDRLDGHMDRGNELMDRNNAALDRHEEASDRNTGAFHRSTEAFDRNMALMDEVRDELRLSREQHEDLRSFINQQNLRADKVMQNTVREIQRLGERVETFGDQSRAHFARSLEEDRAQRQALLQIIDRMDRLDPGSSAS